MSQLILDGKYRVVKVKPGVVYHAGRKVDLRKINAKQADQLIADPNFHYLEKVDKKSSSNKADK